MGQRTGEEDEVDEDQDELRELDAAGVGHGDLWGGGRGAVIEGGVGARRMSAIGR